MSERPRLAVIVPVYNEARTIVPLLERVLERGRPDQVVVVDDGSSDATCALVAESAFTERVLLLHHETNRGKGAAIRTAIPHVRCEVTVIQDGDLEYDPADYARLLEAMQRTGSQVVYGSRNLTPINPPSSWAFYWGGRAVTAAANLLFGTRLTDEPTCYKMFRADLIPKLDLKENRFGIEPEITAKFAKLKVRIYEVGISYYGRTYREGKKIGWKDGMKAVWCIVRYNLFG